MFLIEHTNVSEHMSSCMYSIMSVGTDAVKLTSLCVGCSFPISSRDDLDVRVHTGSPWPCGGQLNPMLCPSAAVEIGREGVN